MQCGRCVVATPVERLKILQQVQVTRCAPTATWACARDLVRARGVGSLFVGLRSAIWRDLPTYPLYFFAYDWARAKAGPEPSAPALAGCGAFAGVLMWLSTYPLDVAKTRIQALRFTSW